MTYAPCAYSPDAAAFLSLIAEQNRLKILCLLKSGEELCVCQLVKELELPQNLLSHHLKSLRDFGLIEARKEGLYVHYHLRKEVLARYLTLTTNLLAPKGT